MFVSYFFDIFCAFSSELFSIFKLIWLFLLLLIILKLMALSNDFSFDKENVGTELKIS